MPKFAGQGGRWDGDDGALGVGQYHQSLTLCSRLAP